MKVAITLVAHEVRAGGGMERQLTELASGLLRRGHAVTVVARQCELSPHPLLSWIRVPGPGRPFPIGYVCYFVAGSWLLRRSRRGLVHTTGAIVFNRADTSTVHFLHRAFARAGGQTRPRRSTWLYRLNARLARTLSLLAERWSYRPNRTGALVAVSGGVAREIERDFPAMAPRVAVIPNGVDLAEFDVPKGAGGQIRNHIGLDEDRLLAVFVGGDWERKGLRFAIEALSTAREWALVVAGVGDAVEYTKLARRFSVHDRVFFIGHRSDMPRLYAAADAFLLPSSYEAFPLVSLEAAAAGLPLLITRLNGVEEVLQDGMNGWFIQRDAAVIAEKLNHLSADPGLRQRMGSAARQAVGNLGWDEMVERYVQHYEHLAAGSEGFAAAPR